MRDVVHDFVDSYFYKNDNYFAVSCAYTYCAFYEIHVPSMAVALGEGGDGKGAFDILESATLGPENSATLDPSIFIDDNEWRKSAHFGLHKKRVCIKEAKKGTNPNKYNIDLLKRFIAGEELIVRANYGFSNVVRFHKMKKQQSANFDDVGAMVTVARSVACPAIKRAGEDNEKKPHKKASTESLGRRCLAAAVGLASLVTEGVCHEEGRFLKMPSDILESVLASPAAAHVYFREILERVWFDMVDEAAIVATLDPDSLDDHMASSSKWYVDRVCGLSVAPRPSCVAEKDSVDDGPGPDVAAADSLKLQECFRILWQNERGKDMSEQQKSVQGRGRKVGEWKVSKLLSSVLGTTRNNTYSSFLDLIHRCGPLAKYFVKADEGINFFGGQQLYLIIFPVDLGRLMPLLLDYNIPTPHESPSGRWRSGCAQESAGYLSCDDDTESHRAGNQKWCSVADTVDLESFRTYVSNKADTRQSFTEGYLRLLERRGTPANDPDEHCVLQALLRDYYKNIFGRLYSSGPSLQKLSKAARKAALQHIAGGVYELDIQNSFLSLLETALRRLLSNDEVQNQFPLLCHFNANTADWINFVANYFEAESSAVKRLFLSALSPRGRQTVDNDERPDWLPHLDALQQEIVRTVEFLLSNDPLYKEVCQKRPDGSALHIYLGELECRAMLRMKLCLENAGAIPISLVYDGIYFRLGRLEMHSEAFCLRISEIESEHGIVIKMKNIDGVKIPWRQAVETEPILLGEGVDDAVPMVDAGGSIPGLTEICESTSTRLISLPGSHMCAPIALYNMDLISGAPSQVNLVNGPYTYRRLQDYYHLRFKDVPLEELLCPDEGDAFILHCGLRDHCGHAIGLKSLCSAKSFLLYDSHNDCVMRISDELLYDIATQLSSAAGRCWLLRVAAEGDVELGFANAEGADCLHLSAGALRGHVV